MFLTQDRIDELLNSDLDHYSDEELSDIYNIVDCKIREDSYGIFLQYNSIDCQRVEELEDRLGMIRQIVSSAYRAKCNFGDMFATVRPWDCLSHDFNMSRGIVAPQIRSRPTSDFGGGFVKEVVPGMYDWVVSIDVTSMYPHIIRAINISPETIQGKLDEMTVDQLLDGGLEKYRSFIEKKDVAVAGNTCYYRRDKVGFLPELMHVLFDERAVWKRRMLDAEKSMERDGKTAELLRAQSTADTMQHSIKIFLNSGFGAVGNRWFRYFDIRNAEAITLTGQLAIRWIERKINEYLNGLMKTDGVDYVIACDTDSAYINFGPIVEKLVGKDVKDKTKIINALDKFAKSVIEPKLERWLHDFEVYVNAASHQLKMKRETICDRAIWRGAKNYILNVWDSEGVRYEKPKLKIKGIEIVKSSTPAVCRNAMKSVVNIMMNGSEEDVIDYCTKFRNEFLNMSFDKIAFPRSVKTLNDYADPRTIYKKGTSAHTRAALVYNTLIKKNGLADKYPMIYNGDKIRWAYMKVPNPINENVIGASDILPKELNLEGFLDKDLQFEKTFIDPIESVLSIIGWSTTKQSSLESFW